MYISDASGKAATFFQYQISYELFNFHGYVKKAVVPPKKLTHEDCAEAFRKKLVHCMKEGKVLVVYLDTMVPQIKKDHDIKEILPLSDLILKNRA